VKKTGASFNTSQPDLVCVKCRHDMNAQNLALMTSAVSATQFCTKRDCPFAPNNLANKVPE
jgi:hypothetical protein